MKRKKENKRVLRAGNNRQSPKRHRRGNPPLMVRNQRVGNRNGRKKKTNGMLVLVMIIALVGFVIGAGIGVSLSLDAGDDDNNETQKIVNVTKQMLNNSSSNQKISYDKEDKVDFNQNQSSNLTNSTNLLNIIV